MCQCQTKHGLSTPCCKNNFPVIESEISPSAVNRQSPAYTRWIQSSLNGILGLQLAVDGNFGTKTRSAVRSFKQRAGLKADGQVGTQTERALMAAGAGSPPVSDASAGSGAPISAPSSTSVLLKRETEPPQETVYANIRLGGEGAARPMTGVFIPQGYKPQSQVDLIIYLHGIKGDERKGYPPPNMSIDGYWNKRRFSYFPLREALNQSSKNVILVAPTLGVAAGHTGWLTQSGGFDRYITQVLAALAASETFKGNIPSVRHIILACHSGGGLPMRTLALSGQRYAQNIKECWGFDCTYFTGDEMLWADWAKSRPDAKLFIYYGSSTQRRSLALKAKNVPNVSVIASTAKSHNRVPLEHWQERLQGADFLANRAAQTDEEIPMWDNPLFRFDIGSNKSIPDIRHKWSKKIASEPESEDEAVALAGLGLAVFSAGREIVTSGDLSVQADSASYVHPNTPVSIPFYSRSIEFKITAFNPRIIGSNYDFFFRLSFEFNGYDLRNVSISVNRPKSSSLYASTFQVYFKASQHSLPNESVARVAYSITNGRWDPYGYGDFSFEATPFLLLINADSSIQAKQINSDGNWVQFMGFVPGTDSGRQPGTPGIPGTGTPQPSGGTPTLRLGSRGAAVTDLQIRLNRWLLAQGRAPLVVDGNFGPKTRGVVIEFQQAQKLTPDGVVGPKTWAVLLRDW